MANVVGLPNGSRGTASRARLGQCSLTSRADRLQRSIRHELNPDGRLWRSSLAASQVTSSSDGRVSWNRLSRNGVMSRRIVRPVVGSTFGKYAAASVLLGVSGLFTEAGMHAAVIQRQDKLQEAATTALIANLVGGITLGLVAAAAAPLAR